MHHRRICVWLRNMLVACLAVGKGVNGPTGPFNRVDEAVW